MRCRTCAARNPAGYPYCLTCGTRVRRETFWPQCPEPLWQHAYCLVRMEDRDGAGPSDAGAPDAGPSDRVGTGYPLDVLRRGGRALTIGSGADCEIVLDHPSVAARHAWLIRHGDHFLIDDADTRDGTFVNGERVKRARRLKVRDTVRLGECQLVYALAEQICPRCHLPDTLTALDDLVAERQDGATGLAVPTHACPQCGHEYWIVASRREGWRRSWLWRWQASRRLLAMRGKRAPEDA
ncbi:MAG: FHA domain-containing protein [Chloroflexi bacterium]|nr:FHA domain-containing protein [Chloroflexota bacterium]